VKESHEASLSSFEARGARGSQLRHTPSVWIFANRLRLSPQSLWSGSGRSPTRLRTGACPKSSWFIGRRAYSMGSRLRLRRADRARTVALFGVRSNHALERTRGTEEHER
jgi:hypothetical protein